MDDAFFGIFIFFYFYTLFPQEKAARLPPVEEIRTVLDHSVRGMLSTFSQVLINPNLITVCVLVFDSDL